MSTKVFKKKETHIICGEPRQVDAWYWRAKNGRVWGPYDSREAAKEEAAEDDSIPAASSEYGATTYSCNCPDFTHRGGSHTDPRNGDKVCKHIYAKRQELNQWDRLNYLELEAV